jgi:hypothetical protein
MRKLIVVRAEFDPEAGVWTTECSDVHGLRIEAETLEALIARLPGALKDLLEEHGLGDDGDGVEVPVELIAHAHTRVRLAA